MDTHLSHFCDHLIEAGWLLAVAVVPAFFDIRTSRVFEPDKGAVLCSLALMMVAVWLIKAIEHITYRLGSHAEWPQAATVRRSRIFYALVVFAVLYAVVTLGSTLVSIHPRISLMGSYQRSQGAYLVLCLIAIGLLIATHLRTRSQMKRLLAAIAIGSLPVTVYAVIQKAGGDPIPWGDWHFISSTLGSPSFLAAYLAMAIPFTIAALILLIADVRNAPSRREAKPGASRWHITASGIFLIVLGLQVYALVISEAQIAPLALLVAAVPVILLLVAVPLRQPQARQWLAGLAALLILGILVTLAVISFADVVFPASSIASLEEPAQPSGMIVRQLIWQGARDLLYRRPAIGDRPDRWAALRPWLGYGPETMYFTYNQAYSPEIGHYETRTATPDRAGNQLLDVGVNLGWVGVAVFLLFLATFFGAAVLRVAKVREGFEAIVACGALWAGLTHFVESQFSIPIVSTLLLLWVGLGTTTALSARHKVETAEEQVADQPPFASAVALLLLPTIALLAVAMAGFWHTTLEGVTLGILTLCSLGVAVLAMVLRRKGPGLPILLALLLLAITCLVIAWLLSNLTKPVPGLSLRTMDDLLRYVQQQTSVLPTLTWGAVLLGWLGVALALPSLPIRLPTWSHRRLITFATIMLYALIVVGALWLALVTNVRPIQADSIFKMTEPYDMSERWTAAIALYEGVIDLAPREDFYYLYLGRAQMEQARAEQSTALQEEWLAQAQQTLERAQALNPLNPAHVANLARFNQVAAELATDSTVREEHLRAADQYYVEATTLAPHSVVLLNEWAILQVNRGDQARACQLLERSLEFDAEFEQTRQLYTDTCAQSLPEQPQNLGFED